MKYCELQGAETNNKGAHLMALCVLAQLKAWGGVEGCVYPRAVPKVARAERLPVLHIFPAELPTRRRAALPRQARSAVAQWALSESDWRRYGLIRRSQIDGLLDLSGYAYGDVWPHSLSKVQVAEAYRQQHKPVVLLPQMLGPFETSRARQDFQRLAEASSIIFARDRISFEQAREAAPRGADIRRAPDITIGFACASPAAGYEQRSGVIVVPNDKVLTKKGGEWGDSYVERLVALLKHVRGRGEQASLLVHEGGGGDRRLAELVLSKLGDSEVNILTDDDPLVLKAWLGRARVVVGSRFHSLVSALSSGTPAVALGWAHKYEMLQEDFDVASLQHRGSDAPGQLLEVVDSLLAKDDWQPVHERIETRRAVMSDELSRMWQTVHDAISR